MKKTRKKKEKLLFSLLVAATLLLMTNVSLQAQSRPGGLFGDPVFSSSSSEGLMDRGTQAGGYNLSNQQFGSDNGGYQLSNQTFGQESPVGSGLAILILAGASYAAMKSRKKNQKSNKKRKLQ